MLTAAPDNMPWNFCAPSTPADDETPGNGTRGMPIEHVEVGLSIGKSNESGCEHSSSNSNNINLY